MKWTRILPIIGLALFVYLIYTTGVRNLLDALKHINVSLFLLSLLFIPVIILLQTYKWQILLKQQGIQLPFMRVVIMQLKSVFYGVVTPGKIGSFIKIHYIKQASGKDVGNSAQSVILDRFLDTITVFVMAFLGAVFIIHVTRETTIIFVAVLVLIALAFYIILNKRFMKFFLGIFFKVLISKKIKQTLQESFETFYHNIPQTKHLLFPFLVNIVTWIIIYTAPFLIAYSLGITQIPYLAFISMYAISTIISIIPITISGIGTREASLVGLFSIYNIPAELTIAMSLLSFFTGTILIACIGAYLSVKNIGETA